MTRRCGGRDIRGAGEDRAAARGCDRALWRAPASRNRCIGLWLLAALGCLAGWPAWAQLSGQLTLTSDYRWRGVSLTDRRPALQGSLSYDHGSGLFAGLFASNVELPAGATGVAAQGFGGYAQRWRDDASWDVGAVGYAFPRGDQGRSYDYAEAFAGVTLERWSARVYLTPDYYGGGDRAAYATLSIGLPLRPWLTLGMQVGVLKSWPRGGSGLGRRDSTRLDARIGLTAELAGLSLEASIAGADTSGCRRMPDACAAGLVISVSRGF